MSGTHNFVEAGKNEITVSDKELAQVPKLRRRTSKKVLELIDSEPVKPDEETEKRMRYSYPNTKETEIKSKYSVSELNKIGYEGTFKFNPAIPRIPEDKIMNAAHVGTVTHSVLEKLDFNAVGKLDEKDGVDAVEALIKSMIERELLTEEEGDAINKEALYEFASGELGRRIAEADVRGTLTERDRSRLRPR